jgi:hypothetical protein
VRHALALLIGLTFQVALGQQRPLETETAETVPSGEVRIESGFESLHDVTYRLSGLRGDLARLGVCRVRIGAGDSAEFQLYGAVRDRLSIHERFPAPNASILKFRDSSTSDVGDLTLGAKFRLRRESGDAPALGFLMAVQLPNASNESGLGNDQTNAFASILIDKKVGEFLLSGNIGLAILGDPLSVGAQDDLMTYGLALTWPASSRVDLVGEFYGRLGSGGIGTEEQTRLRVGARLRAGGFYWDASGLAGFHETDPAWGIAVGVSRQFKLPF